MKSSIIKKLLNKADLNYKRFNENVVKGNSPIIGIRIPDLRITAKEIVKKNSVDKFFQEYEGNYFEEKLIKGVIIGSNESYFNEYIDGYLNELDSWCLVDTFCNTSKFINKSRNKYWLFTKSLIDRKEEFIIRCGYVFMLNYYLTDKYIDEVLNLCLKKFDEYYVNMAIAWLLSEAYINYPKKIIEILKSKKLNEFVHEKTIDKIIDSFRVSISDKRRIRELK